MDTGKDIKVSVCCITYNHLPYLRQCLDGLLMQKTTFDFEILLHDDASTDGTTDIVREYAAAYPDLIRPVIQTENQYSSKTRAIITTYLLPLAKGKYIALCEGDDYWTDPLKLQSKSIYWRTIRVFRSAHMRQQRFTLMGGERPAFSIARIKLLLWPM